MKAFTVLQSECELVDYIIKFNQKKGLEYDDYELKKMNLDTQIKVLIIYKQDLEFNVQNEILSMEIYRKYIENELVYEKSLLSKLDIDQHIKNKNFVKKRIEKRILLIEGELNEEIHEAEEVEEDLKEIPQIENKIEEFQVVNTKNIKIEDIDQSKDDSIIVKHVEEKKPEALKISEIESKPIIHTQEQAVINIKDKKLYHRLKARAEEYKRANDYFIHIQNQKQADDSRAKTITIIKALKEIELGRDVDELSLPNDLTADYICDMSTQQRLENFKIIGKELTNKKKDIKDELESKIEQIKLLNKKEQEKKVFIKLIIRNRYQMKLRKNLTTVKPL